MAKVLKKKAAPFFVNARATLFRDNRAALDELISKSAEFKSESPKARFILMDVYDILSK
jgi:hypothetical protein